MSTFRHTSPVAMGSRDSNDRLRAALHRLGDSGRRPRHVLHYAYPAPGADPRVREAIVAELGRRGFRVAASSLRGGVVFRHDASVACPGFDTMTAEIAGRLAALGWEYDGWECLPPVDVALIYWRCLDTATAR